MEAAVPLIEQKPPPSATAVAPPSIAAELNTAGFIGGLIIALVATASAGTGVFLVRGSEGLFVFCSTYLMEFSLSMDNMFAFYLIFKFYKCPEECQSVCLWFGIAGAVLLRALMMLLGTAVMLTARWQSHGTIAAVGWERRRSARVVSRRRATRRPSRVVRPI